MGARCSRRPTRTSLPLNLTSASDGTTSFFGGGGGGVCATGGGGSDEAHPRARSAAERTRFTALILSSTEEARVARALGQLAVPQDPHLLAPLLEFGSGPQAEELPHRRVVVEGRRLIVEHHVVAHRQTHEEVHAGRGEENLQIFQIVLVAVGVVRVAGIAAHRDAVHF